MKKQKNNLIIIMVDGGFCSQLVKYALGEFLKQERQCEVKYDVSWFSDHGMDCDQKNNRYLQIHKVFPNIEFPIASPEEIRKAKKSNYIYNKQPYTFCSELLSKGLPLYVDGYYENLVYMNHIREKLYKAIDFTHLSLDEENQQVLRQIKESTYSCAVHIRRGDFVNLGLAFLTPEYYINAIRKIQSEQTSPVHFFFFSNDYAYVQQHIIPQCGNIKHTIVTANTNDTGYLDLYLISQCHAQISSNSSFGFWGAFLNQKEKRRVILPSKWISNDTLIYAGIGNGTYAHYIAGSILMDENGNELIFQEPSKELAEAQNFTYRTHPNFLIEETLKQKRGAGICAIYFSSNGLFYPKDFPTYRKTIIEKNRFEWYKTRHNAASKHIFVRDVYTQWYQQGISATHNSIDKCAEFLRKETAGYQIICIGSSAGGYAAMLFAHLLNADICIALSPITNVTERIQLSTKYYPLHDTLGAKYKSLIENPQKYNDIYDLIKDTHTKLYCVFPKYSDSDRIQMDKLTKVNNIDILQYATPIHGQPFSYPLISLLINAPKAILDKIFERSEVYLSEESIVKRMGIISIIKYAIKTTNKKYRFLFKRKFYQVLRKIYNRD